MNIYLSGPITGYENYREYFAMAERIVKEWQREQDLIPIIRNPVEIADKVEKRLEKLGAKATYADYMRNDIKALMECEAIVMLPGWEYSKGALLERKIAEAVGMKVYILTDYYEPSIEEKI